MLLFYVTCPDQGTAETIAKTLMSEKLVACANIIPGMKSFYWWQNAMESSIEFILLLKTLESPDIEGRLQKRIAELHPYEIPCIMGLNVQSVNDAYRKWLEESL